MAVAASPVSPLLQILQPKDSQPGKWCTYCEK